MILARVSVMRHGGTRSSVMCILQYGCLLHWLQPRRFSQMLVRPFSWPSSLFLSALVFSDNQKVSFQKILSQYQKVLSPCSGAYYLSAHKKLLNLKYLLRGVAVQSLDFQELTKRTELGFSGKTPPNQPQNKTKNPKAKTKLPNYKKYFFKKNPLSCYYDDKSAFGICSISRQNISLCLPLMFST